MSRRDLKLLVGACVAVVATAWTTSCSTDIKVPGDSMGLFRFTATPDSFSDNCSHVQEVPRDGGFTFEGTFSQIRDAGPVTYFTINGISRSAVLNGQVVVSGVDAGRRFEVDNCVSDFNAEETLRVVLLSQSQARYYHSIPRFTQVEVVDPDGGRRVEQRPAEPSNCPDGGLDEILATGQAFVDPDAGIVAPSFTPEGFDAIHACGFLEDVLSPLGECPAFDAGPSCTARYFVDGPRGQ